LLRPTLLHNELRDVPGLEKAAAQPLDVDEVLRHRDRMASDWNDSGQVDSLDQAGITLIRGHGRLAGPRAVAVTTPDGATVHLSARHAVAVCTGSRAALPPLPDLETLRPWTSREATSAPRVPRRLAIVGAGVVAVEMATAWQALGSRVTLIAREPRLLPHVEPFAADLVADRLRESGVDLRLETTAVTAVREGGPAGAIHMTLTDATELVVDELLLATGRSTSGGGAATPAPRSSKPCRRWCSPIPR